MNWWLAKFNLALRGPGKLLKSTVSALHKALRAAMFLELHTLVGDGRAEEETLQPVDVLIGLSGSTLLWLVGAAS